MAYYWDDSTNNVMEGIGETQNTENEGNQEVRAEVNKKIEIREEINQKENYKGQSYTRRFNLTSCQHCVIHVLSFHNLL